MGYLCEAGSSILQYCKWELREEMLEIGEIVGQGKKIYTSFTSNEGALGRWLGVRLDGGMMAIN